MRLHGVCIWMTVLGVGLGGAGPASSLYKWAQVVERGMPDFNDGAVAQLASMESEPLHLSFPSGVDVVFVFVRYKGQAYAVYHERATKGVVGIATLDVDPAWSQGLHFYEFYVDSGLLEGDALSGQFLYLAGSDRVFAGMCRIADLANEARPHADCPRKT